MSIFRKMAGAVVVLCLLPIAAALAASIVAYAAGCQYDIGMPLACVVGGSDIGSLVQVLGTFSYGTFFSVPLLILTVTVWLVAELVHLLRRAGSPPPVRKPRSLA
ncbi:conserved exported protein of unknown function [Hyphomicrobium sp. 1Nfss2.1]|uniref:hypothetical protein n=1 Tax=Hyphomicrobium sp. 1Nfss2.1 TaxID=3413936 RepID=UPI003C7A7A09